MSNPAVFAYGTLRRGYCREHTWPRRPLEIRTGFVQGSLVDVGPYPGLLIGNDWIRGEIWYLAEEDFAETLRVLDGVEGYSGSLSKDNWYTRERVNVYEVPGGEPIGMAEVYLLAAPRLIATAKRLSPQVGEYAAPYVEWSKLDASGDA